MILGLLSDTHGHADNAARGIEVLRAAGAEYLIHCGDVGSERIVELLSVLPAAFVFGNTDHDTVELRRAAELYDVRCCNAFGTLELAGKHIALTHGDDGKLLRLLLDTSWHDYLFTGHTHLEHDRRFGAMRAINPGALYRAAEKTVATLDLATDRFVRHVVKVE